MKRRQVAAVKNPAGLRFRSIALTAFVPLKVIGSLVSFPQRIPAGKIAPINTLQYRAPSTELAKANNKNREGLYLPLLFC
jgi:hypothetical protein